MKKVGLTKEEQAFYGILAQIAGFSAGLLVYAYLMHSTVSKNLFWETVRRLGIGGISIAVDRMVSTSINENVKDALDVYATID